MRWKLENLVIANKNKKAEEAAKNKIAADEIIQITRKINSEIHRIESEIGEIHLRQVHVEGDIYHYNKKLAAAVLRGKPSPNKNDRMAVLSRAIEGEEKKVEQLNAKLNKLNAELEELKLQLRGDFPPDPPPQANESAHPPLPPHQRIKSPSFPPDPPPRPDWDNRVWNSQHTANIDGNNDPNKPLPNVRDARPAPRRPPRPATPAKHPKRTAKTKKIKQRR